MCLRTKKFTIDHIILFDLRKTGILKHEPMYNSYKRSGALCCGMSEEEIAISD